MPRATRSSWRFTPIVVFSLPVLLLSNSCQSPGSSQMESHTLLSRGEDQLIHRDFAAAVSNFKEVSTKTENRELKAQALLGLGRCYMEMSQYSKALESFYSARQLVSYGPTGVAIDRGLGEAFFRNGDYGLAHRHLTKALDTVQGPEKDRLLVQLAICAQKNQNPDLAGLYRGLVKNPKRPELQALMQRYPSEEKRPRRAVKPRPKAAPGRRLAKPDVAWETNRNRLAILARNKWRARPTRRNVSAMGPVQRITVHHTGGPNIWCQTHSDTANEIRKIQKNHQSEKGWADIGYHFIIDRAGRVWEGRPLTYQGAHARGYRNAGNIGIVLLGNYLRQRVSTAQAGSLFGLLGGLCRKYRIPPHRILTHSEILGGQTDCPGPQITRLTGRFRSNLVASLQRR